MTRNRTEHQFILTAKDNTAPTLNKVGAGFRSLKSDTLSLAKGIGAVTTPLLAVGAAGAGALTALTVSSLRSADALGKFSDRLGVSSERLAGLRFAAEQTAGFTSGQFDQALQRMTRRVAEAANGTGEAVNALKELGVDAAELSRQSPDEQFTRIADAMKDVEGRSDQVRLAFKLFDSEGVGLVNTLDQGSEGLADFQNQADNLGIALTRFDIAKIEQANDAMNRVKQQAVGLGNSLAVAVAPALTAMTNAWLEATGGAGGFGEIATKAMDYVVQGVGLVADAVRGLHVIWLLLRQGVYEVSQFILGALTQIAAGAQSTINAIASITPGLNEVEFGDRMRQMYTDFAIANRGFRAELAELASMELPSNNIVRYYNETKEAVEQTARATAEARAQIHGVNDFDPEDNMVGPTAAQLEKQLQSLYDFLATEEERIERSYKRRQDILDHSLRQQQISQERHAELTAQLREREFLEQAKKDQERRQKLQSELETVTNLFQSEEEKVNAAFDRRATVLRNSLDDRLIDDERYAELSIQLEQRRQKELTRVEKESQSDRQKFLGMSFREQATQVTGFLEENTRALAKESKTWFEINKALAATQSAVNTYEAVTKTLGAYPFPLNIGLAGVVAANGFAQVRQIMAQNFSGRSGSASTSTSLSSGGGSAASTQQYAQPVGQQASLQNVTFNIQTSGKGDDPQAIVQVMRDYFNNDGVLFEQGSAQYQVVNG